MLYITCKMADIDCCVMGERVTDWKWSFHGEVSAAAYNSAAFQHSRLEIGLRVQRISDAPLELNF